MDFTPEPATSAAGAVSRGRPQRPLWVAGGVLLVAALTLGSFTLRPHLSRLADHRRVQKLNYIRVAPNGRYFQFEDGRPFIVIGQNEAITWPNMAELYNRNDPEVTEAYLRTLQEHGVNTIRVMAEYCQFDLSYLQNPIGTFVPETVQYWDDFFALAERYGIYVIFTPWDTFWMFRNLDRNPWYAANGGPLEEPRDWLRDPEVIAAQKETWRFIIDRWGDSPNILAWELMNEVEMWWGNTEEEILRWAEEMAAFVREYERQRWGKNHLITISVAKNEPTGLLADLVFRHPLIDFANTHLYYEPAVNNPPDTISAALAVNHGVRHALAETRENPRPYLDTESGPISRWPLQRDFDLEYYHNMSWAHLASGGAGQGLRWPYTQPHTLPPEFRKVQAAMARFAAAVDWLAFTGHRNIDQQLTVTDPQLIAMGTGDDRRAVVWLLRDTRPAPASGAGDPAEAGGPAAGGGAPGVPGPRLTVAGLAPGTYAVEFWDTWAGVRMAERTLEAGPEGLVIDLPAIDRSLALYIAPR